MFKLFLIFSRGDWEYESKVFKFPRWDNQSCCKNCQASLTDDVLLYSRAGPSAGWRSTLRSHEGYLAELERDGKPVPILMRSKTLRLEGCMTDPMHTIDLGIGPHLNANVFIETMQAAGWGRTQAAQIERMQGYLKDWQRKQPHIHKLQGKLTFSRIRTGGDWPKLKCKAAQCRHLLCYSLDLSQRFTDGSLHDQRRTACCQLLCRFFVIINKPAKVELATIGPLFVQMYNYLADEALRKGIRAYKFVPKFHMFMHICEHQTFINPRLSWCYLDEDLQRFMKKIALSCHALNLAPMVMLKVLIVQYDDDEDL